MVSLLANLTAHKFGTHTLPPAVALKEALGKLRGPFVKIAQILSTVPDLLPPEYREELRELQSKAPPMGSFFVKRRMAGELGPLWQENFNFFDLKACAAASLGQVHQAQDKAGKLLACKLQYPGMASTIEADLTQFKWALSLYENYSKALKTGEVYQEIAERLREELDYQREAKNLKLYQEFFKKDPDIQVPQVQDTLSTSHLLTMTWLEGKSVLTLKEAPLETRNHIAKTLFKAWYFPLYHYGVLHGDPHLGNYTVQPHLKGINLLDFGSVRIFEPAFIKSSIELYKALQTKDEARAVQAYESWGFKNPTPDLIKILNLWANYLYGPLLEDRVRPIEENFSSDYGCQIAATIHEELKKIGGITPPRSFVLMDRAAVGMGSVFMHLRAEVNWHQLFESFIENFDLQELTQRQTAVLSAVGL